jgi:tellurite resistance-related uncharacterized protein
MPAGLLRAHRIASGTWGRIVVRHGQLRFDARTEPKLDVVLGPDVTQPVPPEVEHEVRPLGPVRFSIDFLSIHERDLGIVTTDGEESRGSGDVAAPRVLDEGGKPACSAHLLYPECGAVLDGVSHMKGCGSDANP